MRIAKTASMLGGLCLVAVGGCAATSETAADQVSPTPWIPTEPSYGAPVFPGAEFVSDTDRDPGEYWRTWVQVIGQGRSYCVEDEEFWTEASYADVVAWYRQRLGEKGARPVLSSGKSWSWVVTDDRDARVTVTITPAGRSRWRRSRLDAYRVRAARVRRLRCVPVDHRVPRPLTASRLGPGRVGGS